MIRWSDDARGPTRFGTEQESVTTSGPVAYQRTRRSTRARGLIVVTGLAAVPIVGSGADVSAATRGAAPPGYQHLVDDSGQLSIDVPAAWTDVLTGTVEVETAEVPSIAAVPPASAFPGDIVAPGALYVAFPFQADVARLAAVFQPDVCPIGASQPYQNGALSGVVVHYTGCGPTGAEQYVVAANPADSAYTGLLVLSPGVPLDPAIAATVLPSLNRQAAAMPPGPVPTHPFPVPATTVPLPQPPVTTTAPTVAPAPAAVTTTAVPPVPATTAPIASPVTTPAPSTSVAPVTTTPALAGPDANGVTVTNSGDSANRVDLLAPFTVGARGDSQNYATLTGTITVSGAQNWSTGWETSSYHVGLDEVLAVNADGSVRMRYTQSSIETSETFTNPDLENPTTDDPMLVEGVPLIIEYGPDRQSTSVTVEPGTTVTAEQQAVVDTLAYTMPGAGFPAAPVGVGATWTAVEPVVTFEGAELSGTVSYRLLSISGDLYEVDSTTTIDVAAVDQAGFPDNVTSASGTFTVTITMTGNITSPMQYREVSTIRTNTTTTYTDGTTWVVNTVQEHSFEERPL